MKSQLRQRKVDSLFGNVKVMQFILWVFNAFYSLNCFNTEF